MRAAWPRPIARGRAPPVSMSSRRARGRTMSRRRRAVAQSPASARFRCERRDRPASAYCRRPGGASRSGAAAFPFHSSHASPASSPAGGPSGPADRYPRSPPPPTRAAERSRRVVSKILDLDRLDLAGELEAEHLREEVDDPLVGPPDRVLLAEPVPFALEGEVRERNPVAAQGLDQDLRLRRRHDLVVEPLVDEDRCAQLVNRRYGRALAKELGRVGK